MERDKA